MTHRRYVAAVSSLCVMVGCFALAVGAGVPSSAASAARHHVSGDFDGDGRPDLVVGGSGLVRITYTHARPHGSSVQMRYGTGGFGQTLAIGDFNGDGYADLIVGEPYAMHPADPSTADGMAETMGAVLEYLGSSTGLHRGPATITGPYDGDEPYSLGMAIAAADVNGDGYADLAVSVPEADSDNLRIYRGGPHGLITSTFQALDGQGPTALAFADVNGDGRPELVAGPAYLNGDGILVFHNTGHGLTNHHPQQLTDQQLGVYQEAGTSLAAGDINADGYSDVVVGAAYDDYLPSHPSPGHIVVLRGSSHGLSAARRQTLSEAVFSSRSHNADGFGAALSIAHVTGRRYADLIVGAPNDRVNGLPGAGAVYLLRGTSAGLSRAHAQRFTQASPGIAGAVTAGANFGGTVLGLRLNRDGYADAVIGAPHSNYAAHDGGLTLYLSGGASGLTTHGAHAVAGRTSGMELGLALR